MLSSLKYEWTCLLSFKRTIMLAASVGENCPCDWSEALWCWEELEVEGREEFDDEPTTDGGYHDCVGISWGGWLCSEDPLYKREVGNHFWNHIVGRQIKMSFK